MRFAPPIVLTTAVLALLAAACDSNPEKPRSEMTGRELFLDARCDSCHGGDRAGSWMGPSLATLEQHWTEQPLADFLLDPLPIIEADPRLSKLRRSYPASMRPFFEFTPSERLRIASWLLSAE